MVRKAATVLVGVALVTAAGCGSSSDKAGGSHAPKALILTLANFTGDSEEVDGFAAEVKRLSLGTMQIAVRSGWRHGQVDAEAGLIRDVKRARRTSATSAAAPGTPWG